MKTPALSERYLRVTGRLDRVIAALALLLAFVLASFPARNSDVWRRLASGRLIASFDYSFGVDPFAFTTANSYWANHSWLGDMLLYLVALPGGPQGSGGILAVFLKALAAVALALVMMSIRRPGPGLWAAAVGTALAVITLSPGLELRPMMASLLLLALTLWVLVRESKPPPTAETRGLAWLWTASPRRLYALPFLFCLWVNLDGWFWLGPFCVALFLLGETLQEQLTPILAGADHVDPEERRTLKITLGLGLAATLVNPHHLRAWTAPPELFAGSRFADLNGDPYFQPYFTGPLDDAYFVPHLGLNLAGLTYFLLLALAIGSFALAGWRWWRVVLLAGFAVPSLLSMRLIPYFAVAAGPILVLNLQEFIARDLAPKLAEQVRWRRSAVAGRGITIQTLVVLLILAWAGWLNAPQAQRRLGWGIAMDPSLIGVTRQLQQLPAGPVVNTHPDLAAYLAWFCPDHRGFFDDRIELMGVAARGSYARLRVAGQSRQGPPPDAVWSEIRRQWPVQTLVLSGSHGGQTADLFGRLAQDLSWTLVWLDGRSAIFGWQEGSPWPSLDLAAAAFGPAADPAPLSGPNREPRTDYLAHFFQGTPERPLDADLAGMYVVYYQSAGRRQLTARRQQLAQLTELAVTAPAWPGAPAAASAGRIALLSLARSNALLQRGSAQDLGPPAAPILAVRAARRASADNPDDASVYLHLAQGYDILWRTQENHWAGVTRLPDLPPARLLQLLGEKKEQKEPAFSPWVDRSLEPRQFLRQVQLVAALRQLLQVDPPDADFIHRKLYELFSTMNYYDVALEHLRAEVDILRRRLGESRAVEARARYLASREREVELLRRQAGPAGPQTLLRPFGLADEAMQRIRLGPGMLRPDDVDLYLYLALTTGRLAELQTALEENRQLPQLIGSRYQWYQAMLAAARGNYQEADRQLGQALERLPSVGPPLAALLQSLTADQLATPVLGQAAMRPILRQQATVASAAILEAHRDAGDLHLLRGLLALEQGDTPAARNHFRRGLPPDGKLAPVASRYLELLE